MHGSLGTLITSFKYQLKSLWNAKAVLLTKCQKSPAQIAPQWFSSYALSRSFLPPVNCVTLGADVSRIDQSTSKSWMRKLTHFHHTAGFKKPYVPSPLALGTCHTTTTLKYNRFTGGRWEWGWGWGRLSLKVKSSQLSIHSHLPLSMINLNRTQAMPG